MANGRPSSFSQIVATSSGSYGVSVGPTALAIRPKSSVASSPSWSAPSCTTCSPTARSGPREVAKTVTFGAAQIASTVARTLSATCSQLSSTTAVVLRWRRSSANSAGLRVPLRTPTATPMRNATSSAVAFDRSHHQGASVVVPSSARSWATATASAVLPMPPAPVIVTTECCWSSSWTRARSSTRPIRPPGTPAGRSCGPMSASSWWRGSSRCAAWRNTSNSSSRSPGPGSMPRSVRNNAATSRAASSASRWRPERYNAKTRSSQRRSRYGWASARMRASAATASARPRSSMASRRRSSVSSRSVSRRVCQPRSSSMVDPPAVSPRHNESAASSDARSSELASVAADSNCTLSMESASTASRHVSSADATASTEPSSDRNLCKRTRKFGRTSRGSDPGQSISVIMATSTRCGYSATSSTRACAAWPRSGRSA